MNSSQLSQQISDLINGRSTQRQNDYQNLYNQYGLNDRLKSVENVRRSLLDTEKILSDLPRNIRNRTAGRMMTDAQRARLMSAERDPLAQQMGDLGRQEQANLAGFDASRGEVDRQLGLKEQAYNAMLQNLMGQRSAAWSSEADERNRTFQKMMRDTQWKYNDLPQLNAVNGLNAGLLNNSTNQSGRILNGFGNTNAYSNNSSNSNLSSGFGGIMNNVLNMLKSKYKF